MATTANAPAPTDPATAALLDALRVLPLALARGLPFQATEELLKLVFEHSTLESRARLQADTSL